MKKKIGLLAILLYLGAAARAQQVWQKLTLPTYAGMLAHLKEPPLQYAETVTYGLEGPLSREAFATDLDAMYRQGIRAVSIEAGYGMKDPYLSPGYFGNIKILVDELKKRGMHLWIIDESKYPSGFAGGKFSQERPDLRMQGLVIGRKLQVKAGQTIHQQLDTSFVSAVAVNAGTGDYKPIPLNDHTINWTAPTGDWQVLLAQHRFKTSVTRASNNPTHGKDTVNSLCDYINPAATRQFLEFTHVQYKKYIGDEFGKTVLGFRGDEPEYNFTPWTPGIVEIFRKKKGYDVTPYLASFFVPKLSGKSLLVKADYWDVWSDLFRDNFFKVQADWCAQNGLEYMVHIDHEDQLMSLARTEGDYFKDMRYVQIPGVDAIWHQIWYDNAANFPKIASSAAHMYGRPRALSESFAAYTPKPTVADARWVVNEQLVRGINLFEYMFWSSSAGRPAGKSYLTDPDFPSLAAYSNRASYLLANGIPAAQVGLYCPTGSMWLGKAQSDSSLLHISNQLLEHQIDFDFVDDQGLGAIFKIDHNGFTNLSGQRYHVIIIPGAAVLTSGILDRLRKFENAGGKVIFMDDKPVQIPGNSFTKLNTNYKPDWALTETSGQLTDRVLNYMTRPDVELKTTVPSVKYLHRKWQDAEFYFFFNEGDADQKLEANLSGTGKAEVWNADDATVTALSSLTTGGRTILQLKLPAHASRFVIIHHLRSKT